jgi:hypothetical protein
MAVDFWSVDRKDLFDTLQDILKGEAPDAVIIDHILSNVARPKGEVRAEGSTVAGMVRDNWPRCPIIGVSAARKAERARALSKAQYDAFYSYLDLKAAADYLPIVAMGFRKVAACIGKDDACLTNLLDAPPDEENIVRAVMPENLRTELDDDTLPGRMFRWVDGVLRSRPGPLYDRLWTATLLGIKEDSVEKVHDLLAGAAYTGVFANPDGPRWWRDTVKAIIFDKTGPGVGELPWEAGRRLPGITPKDHSHCYACQQDLPDTVAYLDEVSDKLEPMHRRCTVPHPRYKKEPFFEEIRMMG